MNILNALKEWSELAGVIVLDGERATAKFKANTLSISREISGVVEVVTAKQIQEVVAIANKNQVPLYPISGGHNWGYGSSLSSVDNCVILDLSRMNKIIELNDSLGYVVLEPGVTQKQLHEYIKERNLRYMVPTTGAGPQGSIVGNALEKGYGITPHEDHFGAVLSLKAVLPSGEIYESALAQFGGYRSDPLYKWKIGPYLEGLFVQGNMGVVTQATIALARKPEKVTQFLVFVDDKNFEAAIGAIARVKQQCGTLLGGVNIMNRRRLLSMMENQQEWALNEGPLSDDKIDQLAKKRNLTDWVVMGAIYSPLELTDGATKVIKREFKTTSRKILFLSNEKLKFIKYFLNWLPLSKIKNTLITAERALTILEGVPDTVALRLAYLKNRRSTSITDVSPDKDGCGLIWFSPLLPIDPAFAREYTNGVKRICLSNGIEPLITLTAISERCFDSTIPILFNQDDEKDVARAHECHRALLEFSKGVGVFPYRININAMREIYDNSEGGCFTMLEKIKNALDPNNIIAPGRYIKNKLK